MDTKQKQTHPNKSAEEKQQIIAPMALAEIEIMKLENAKRAAAKNPEIRNIALLLLALLGVTLVSQIGAYLIAASFDAAQTDFFSTFITSNGVIGIAILLIQITAISILLFTRNTSHAKTIILLIGICFGIALINSIVSFRIGPTILTDVAVLVIMFLIFRKIFKAYLEL